MPENPCKNCKYYYSIAQNERSNFGICQYLLMTGKRRPCKGGENCTVKERKTRARRKHTEKETCA